MVWNYLISTFFQMQKANMNCISVDIQLTSEFQPTVSKVHITPCGTWHMLPQSTHNKQICHTKNVAMSICLLPHQIYSQERSINSHHQIEIHMHSEQLPCSCFKSYNKAALTKCVYLLTLYQYIQISPPTSSGQHSLYVLSTAATNRMKVG